MILGYLPDEVSEWGVSEVCEWLLLNNIPRRVVVVFEQNLISGKGLIMMTPTDLREELGISSYEHRKRIQQLLHLLRENDKPPTPPKQPPPPAPMMKREPVVSMPSLNEHKEELLPPEPNRYVISEETADIQVELPVSVVMRLKQEQQEFYDNHQKHSKAIQEEISWVEEEFLADRSLLPGKAKNLIRLVETLQSTKSNTPWWDDRRKAEGRKSILAHRILPGVRVDYCNLLADQQRDMSELTQSDRKYKKMFSKFEQILSLQRKNLHRICQIDCEKNK